MNNDKEEIIWNKEIESSMNIIVAKNRPNAVILANHIHSMTSGHHMGPIIAFMLYMIESSIQTCPDKNMADWLRNKIVDCAMKTEVKL